MKSQWDSLKTIRSMDSNSEDIDTATTFPEMSIPAAAKAILTLTESLGYVLMSPLPKFTFWCLSQLPYMRKAKAAKESMITSELEKAISRINDGSKSGRTPRCAMDEILRREHMAATKENREPMYKTRAIYDEVSEPGWTVRNCVNRRSSSLDFLLPGTTQLRRQSPGVSNYSPTTQASSATFAMHFEPHSQRPLQNVGRQPHGRLPKPEARILTPYKRRSFARP